MNRKIKNPFVKQITKQKGTVAILCIMCALFFMASGCEKRDDANGDSYYFYNSEGKKVYLTLNTKYAFLSVDEPQLPIDIAQRGMQASEFKSDNSDTKQYQGKYGQRRYFAELSIENDLTSKQYLKLLSDIKDQNSNVIIAPYFKDQYGKKVGLTNFFYVKLKEEKDIALLKQKANQHSCIIIMQDDFMPLWFTLSVTEASGRNALECANFFHESGLFQAGEADLMPDSLIEPWL